MKKLTRIAILSLGFSLFLVWSNQSSFAQHTEYYSRPIPMGVSISTTGTSPYIFAGTAGMLVRSIEDPSEIFILSNNHVMGAVGPTLCPNTAPIGTEILQPGTLDIGFDPGPDPEYVVGQLAEFVPITFRILSRNKLDAAIAGTTFDLASPEILGIGFPSTEIGEATPGMAVTKSGRTTGVTSGVVESIHTSVIVRYGDIYCRVARFVDQVVFDAMSDAGDSGSVILESQTLKPVALLFAGSSTNTIGSPFSTVSEAFGVVPVGGPDDPVNLQGVNSSVRDSRLERIKAIKSRNEDRIMDIPGVVGFGIGLSQDGSRYEFVIYSDKTGPNTERGIPKEIEGIPVRLKRSGEFKAF